MPTLPKYRPETYGTGGVRTAKHVEDGHHLGKRAALGGEDDAGADDDDAAQRLLRRRLPLAAHLGQVVAARRALLVKGVRG